MRKLIVISFLTLDGVMQAPGAKDEDNEGGFNYGGWQVPFFEDGDNTILEELSKAGALLLGRKTYDIFAGYWPTVGTSVEGFGTVMNNITKYVASHTLRNTEWKNSILLEGNASKAIDKLKKEAGKDIYVFGSGDLSQTLMAHNLVDEFLLMVHPLVLGKGKRLFRPEGPKQDLELLKSWTSKKGVSVLTYKVRSDSESA
jgi:dihydrofolate reductase